MQQLILPIIPEGATEINDHVCVWRGEERWTYFMGTHPIYSHQASNQRMFRLITALLIDTGACRQIEILNTFGIPKSNVDRSLRLLRAGGPESFFTPRKGHKTGTVLTSTVLEQAQKLFDQGSNRHEVATELGVRSDTLYKAIKAGRLQESMRSETATTKSSRDLLDTQAATGMGTACTRVEERTLAAFGVCDGAPVRFEPCLDVPKGGVLCALPALLANGLLEGCEMLLREVNGYYKQFHILLLLAFMSLCRIKTLEKFRGHAPGEFGKIMGLDRVPEVRCLRNKMDEMSAGNSAEIWAAHLSRQWMQADPDAAGVLYVDGHVRVYHGNLTKLPRRYVSREKLCLRGNTDYWVNDAIGRPFFVVEKVVDAGLLDTLRKDIVPRLIHDVPGQPSDEVLESNKRACRFVMVFDREGYSPAFFHEMWEQHRIACMTYHKHPKDTWPEEWFTQHEVGMPNGETVTMRLAEKESSIGAGNNTITVREVRKLNDSGHQTSLISTCYEGSHTLLAARMFSRWCQENFFRYMMQHFAIDLLLEYGTEKLGGAEQVINPAWRDLNKSCHALTSKLKYRKAIFAEMTLHPYHDDNKSRYEKQLQKKATLLEEIQHYEQQLTAEKARLKETAKRISWEHLGEKDQFHRLLPGRKRLMDTVRMVTYRAETAMASLLVSPTVDFTAARTLLQNLFVTEADILPDVENKVLLVRIHSASRPAANRSLDQLITKLNEASIQYPGTDLQVKYELRGFNL